MRTFEFATPHGRIGMLILVPGTPPDYYWAGRVPVPDELRDHLTRGITDPETGKRIAGDKGEEFLEVLQLEYLRGRHLAGRKGAPIQELPRNARKILYTPGVAGWFTS
ncbi:MAG TPA: hypothetical protein PK313_06765 [Myxococcota bacterium]|jgi:hypothetical protein|nr:hypothetical protein [Myxococcota bacterium]